MLCLTLKCCNSVTYCLLHCQNTSNPLTWQLVFLGIFLEIFIKLFKYFDGDQDVGHIEWRHKSNRTTICHLIWSSHHTLLFIFRTCYHMAKIDWGGGGLLAAFTSPSCIWWWYGVKGGNRPSSLSASHWAEELLRPRVDSDFMIQHLNIWQNPRRWFIFLMHFTNSLI